MSPNSGRLKGEHIRHLVNAFLCVKNRYSTMVEHGCNEYDLFRNPTWLLSHYFEKSGLNFTQEEREEIISFALDGKFGLQVTEAFLCPVNRHCTRVEHNCSDEFFIEGNNYILLLNHFIEKGGAAAFADEREEREKKHKEKMEAV